jgi:hypothetical protein
MAKRSAYVVQRDGKSFCPKCRQALDLLCRRDGQVKRAPWFYICWVCMAITEVGKSEVPRESPYGETEQSGGETSRRSFETS